MDADFYNLNLIGNEIKLYWMHQRRMGIAVSLPSGWIPILNGSLQAKNRVLVGRFLFDFSINNYADLAGFGDSQRRQGRLS